MLLELAPVSASPLLLDHTKGFRSKLAVACDWLWPMKYRGGGTRWASLSGGRTWRTNRHSLFYYFPPPAAKQEALRWHGDLEIDGSILGCHTDRWRTAALVQWSGPAPNCSHFRVALLPLGVAGSHSITLPILAEPFQSSDLDLTATISAFSSLEQE